MYVRKWCLLWAVCCLNKTLLAFALFHFVLWGQTFLLLHVFLFFFFRIMTDLFKKCIYFHWRLITLQYCSGFCHRLTWISHGFICVPHPETPSHHPPHIISLGHPSAPAPSILYPVLNLDWRFVSYMIVYMFRCHSSKSSHSLPLLQSPKDCSIHLCLFCCLAYRVIVTIFLNSIYMC